MGCATVARSHRDGVVECYKLMAAKSSIGQCLQLRGDWSNMDFIACFHTYALYHEWPRKIPLKEGSAGNERVSPTDLKLDATNCRFTVDLAGGKTLTLYAEY